jgi:septal ring factor EnvC (AmiA/AmiB activator)
VNYKSQTPFDNIESALEYVNHLLDATQEARAQVETEILRTASPELARRKQALQLVRFKLDKLSSHIAASRRILNDLRTLRRLLLEERKTPNPSAAT